MPRPIAIVGPTASGKSDLSLDLAEHLNGEIVNVDSMQLYRGMDIGTAKVPHHQRRGIPHHLFDVLEVTETASVARYQQQAVATVDDIRRRHKTPIIVGGSMLYVQSLVDDWQFPPTDHTVRARYETMLADHGLPALRALLRDKDPHAASIIEEADPRRTVRALEVIELTGKPFAASQPPINQPARWNTVILGLATTPEWLNPRIDTRTRTMFDTGLIEETRHLVTAGLVENSTAGRAIGYLQALQHLAGELTLDEAIEATIFGTRRYVRRQRSWFKRDPRTLWLDASNPTTPQALTALGINPTS
ncbi:tRNA delta(2)-isopentenylpyrophosphate transferase [Corynebacterium aquilae DSM 44791]|uniref:tRNA dimethylallyltransferase n=1 Tax=Corynebacterium aquilae DSM 44791 TaxID=1431546 RepID=A0A1L7CGH8_9CORY|nr:tRNA (adenosine(37)-N6)-dimethylallyltransferase MiaA [Corynebacterium aquilae]APT84924.1 tRNA delta(2)-isopentenylpyrophosphate transferase [Corynebacterium aquilae DSM 44791]